MNNLKTAASHRSARVHPLGLLMSAALLFTCSTLPVVAGGRAADQAARRPAVETAKTPANPTASKAPVQSKDGGRKTGESGPKVDVRPPAAADLQPAALGLQAQPGEVIRDLTLQPNQAQILEFRPVTQVAVVNPAIADVMLVSPTTLVLSAKSVGETLLFVTYTGGRSVFRVVVAAPPQPDLGQVARQIEAGINRPGVTVRAVGRVILIEGEVANEAEIARARAILRAFGIENTSQLLLTVRPQPTPEPGPPPAEVAAQALRSALGVPDITIRVLGPNSLAIEGHVKSQSEADRIRALVRAIAAGVEVVDLIVVPAPEPPTKRQVLIHARVVEINRTRTKELGINFGPAGDVSNPRFLFSQIITPNSPQGPTIGPIDNLFGGGQFIRIQPLAFQLNMLARQGAARILSEPNLMVLEGATGNILVGGEFPYPAVQSSASGASSNAITIEFRQFGIRLEVTPELITEDEVTLRVVPEVSALDFANGVTISGTIVPALTTRRAQTTVRIQDGQSLAIGGLLQDLFTRAQNGVAGIAQVPVLGDLFKSRQFIRNLTELVILISPEILGPGQAPSTPVPPNEMRRPVPPRLLAPMERIYGSK
jgi:pilus assembly protein CpaC